MLFLGWQGIYTFLFVCIAVFLMIIFFAKRLNNTMSENETNFVAH